jgi:hypothetical protein
VVQLPNEHTELPTCSHLEFGYLDVIDEFIYLAPNFEPLIEKWKKSYEDEDCDFTNKAMVIQFNDHGLFQIINKNENDRIQRIK